MIIGITGKAGSGKDTVGSMIQHFRYTQGTEDYDSFKVWDNPAWQHLLNCDCNFEIRKFAAKVKEVASILTGFPVKRFDEHNFKKSLLGEEWATDCVTGLEEPFPDVIFRQFMTVREFLQKLGTDAVRNNLHPDTWVNALWADYDNDDWIITDVRFKNEVNSIKNRGGIIIRLTRNQDSKDTHDSETALDNYKADFVIDNQVLSLEATFYKVKELYEQIIQEANSEKQRVQKKRTQQNTKKEN
ncbi:MAG: hypothetical protein ACOC4J_06205 [Bacteroidota bacterium]